MEGVGGFMYPRGVAERLLHPQHVLREGICEKKLEAWSIDGRVDGRMGRDDSLPRGLTVSAFFGSSITTTRPNWRCVFRDPVRGIRNRN